MRRLKGSESSTSLSRRETVLLGTSFCVAAIAGSSPARESVNQHTAFSRDTEIGAMTSYDAIHGGKGSVGVKRFPFDGNPSPANFIIYDIPPGASEGVHVHHLDNRNKEGPYDEYYYIISGQGQMRIDGKDVLVSAGDHVHTPLDVAHGIENTHPEEHPKVFLTFITRTSGA
jgi:mannose-6-phosphate isomerase-like protein (cupin superfamily)